MAKDGEHLMETVGSQAKLNLRHCLNRKRVVANIDTVIHIILTHVTTHS